MKADIKDLWVNALESGEYQQTKAHLHLIWSAHDRDTPGYCCLGVLCDLAVKAGIIPAPVILENYAFSAAGFGQWPAYGVLPEEVQAWAGLDSDDPEIYADSHDDSPWTLASLNDHGKTFPEIAQIIRETL